MAVETFVPKTFTPAHQAIIEQADAICASYARQGLTMTLRQVYYQFVARDLLPNKQTEYKRLGGILNDARLAGQLDWSYMEDRGRGVHGGYWGYDDPGSYIASIADGYYEAIWDDQDYRPEVWVEKEALVSIVAQGCAATRTPYFACKGNVSQSEMYAAAKRMRARARAGHTPIVIHLGDHDPSGVDMTRDNQERLSLMAGREIEVRRIALTMDQVREINPPPNPVKLTDSRAPEYVAQYGVESWELDALDPAYLRDLVAETIEEYLDRPALDAALEHETENEQRIRDVADRWPDLVDHWDDVQALLDDES